MSLSCVCDHDKLVILPPSTTFRSLRQALGEAKASLLVPCWQWAGASTRSLPAPTGPPCGSGMEGQERGAGEPLAALVGPWLGD